MKIDKRLLLLLLTACMWACNKSSPTPTDALYQRWQLIEEQITGGQWKPVTNGEIIEFRTDGSVHYENRLLCCSATQVTRQRDVLNVKATYLGAGCETVSCAPVTKIKIVTLTDNELTLQMFFGSSTGRALKYRAIP